MSKSKSTFTFRNVDFFEDDILYSTFDLRHLMFGNILQIIRNDEREWNPNKFSNQSRVKKYHESQKLYN